MEMTSEALGLSIGWICMLVGGGVFIATIGMDGIDAMVKFYGALLLAIGLVLLLASRYGVGEETVAIIDSPEAARHCQECHDVLQKLKFHYER